MTIAMLSVVQLTFAWPGTPLFRDWSCDFGPGLTWMRGDNGCGKSTLLRLLGGSLDPHAGRIRHAGFDAQESALDYRRHVYWCGPDGPVFDHLKPLEFFGFIAGLYPDFDARMAAALIEPLGLSPFTDRRIGQLSTGSRRKVAVVAALSAGTPVVLLDEPLAALDRASAIVIRRHLAAAALQRERAWIVTSHEPLGADVVPNRLLDLPPRR